MEQEADDGGVTRTDSGMVRIGGSLSRRCVAEGRFSGLASGNGTSRREEKMMAWLWFEASRKVVWISFGSGATNCGYQQIREGTVAIKVIL
jgi:hypothetical protein